jgi:hypothetical protein
MPCDFTTAAYSARCVVIMLKPETITSRILWPLAVCLTRQPALIGGALGRVITVFTRASFLPSGGRADNFKCLPNVTSKTP